jgi:5-methylthioadenosine/S-adenosylhomocysteine deaminase
VTQDTGLDARGTVVEARWVVPVEPFGAVLPHHAVVVRDGRILAVLPSADVRARYPALARVELPTHLLIPGLINLHTHAAMALMRGIADDLPLKQWLEEHIWPTESRHVSPEFVYDGTLLAAAEMLRGGVTCFNDMYFFPEATVRAARDAHIRAVVGLIALEFPTPYAAGPEEYLARGLAVRERFAHDPWVSFAVAPHAPYTVSDASFTRVLRAAEEHDLRVHLHVHETDGEIVESEARHRCRPLQRLAALGVVNARLVAAHCVHLTDDEIALLADRGAHVAHCPAANLKLASGIARIAAMADGGVNVGVGTDGAASNNRLDMLAELRLAALLGKAAAGRADALPAHQVLAMGTINAARALGLEARIGSIVSGKEADLAALDLGSLELQPVYDPVSHAIYAAGRESVTHVWVRGEPVLIDGALRTVDAVGLRERAAAWGTRLAGQEGR